MKAHELRIGNLVFKRGASDTIVIDAHNIEQLQKWEMTKYAETPPFEPIPLTEEWLLRMGFDFDSQSQTFSVLGVNNLYGWVFEIHMSDGNFLWSAMPVYWVHQLQNLYFALTGEEPTIKEQ